MFNDRIRAKIQVCRHKERTWNNNPTEYNFQAFYYQRRYVANIIKAAQRCHFIDLFTENKNDFKKIFSIANTLLHRETARPLPPTDDYHKLANDFNMFFINKIKKIMERLQSSNNIDNGPSDDTSWCTETNFTTNFRLHAFDPVETDYMLQQVKKVAVKSCELNPIPAKVLIKHTSSLAESIKDIINTSLLFGEVSKNLKDAILQLLLKKANLNLVFTNYRPVSNLSYISKMIERAVIDQIQVAAERSGNLEPLQSAYRVGHSTETALLKVKSDFLKAIDKDEAVCLMMLVLSTTFDTVSHELLLNCLKFRFGICDTALAWIKSYLSDRTQSVSIDDGSGITVTSDKASLS